MVDYLAAGEYDPFEVSPYDPPAEAWDASWMDLSEDELLDIADEDYDDQFYGAPGNPSHPPRIEAALTELERRGFGVKR